MDERNNTETDTGVRYNFAQDGTYSGVYQDESKKAKKKNGGGKIIALALVFSLIGGILGAGAVMFWNDRHMPEPETVDKAENIGISYEGSRPSGIIDTVAVDTSRLMSAAEVYAANVNSTVGITTSITTTNYWGYTSTTPASGSGFIFTDNGYILTNFHVIEDSNSITVTLYDDRSFPAEIVGYDSSNDIAVIKIDTDGLTPVVLGESSNMNVGDDVVAIGNPLGELTFSLTAGTVSALDRKVTLSSNVTMKLIQTDCAINAGNSGGPLFNMYGEVIGITNAKYSSSSNSGASIDNIGFAIPINTVKGIVTSIIEKGYISKPYIGITVGNVGSEAQAYGLPEGAAVKEIVEGSPAEEAGLQINDIITSVDGTAITGSDDLVEIIAACEPGQVLRLEIYRQNETMSLELTVGEKVSNAVPETDAAQTEEQTPAENGNGYSFDFGFGNGGFPFDFGDIFGGLFG